MSAPHPNRALSVQEFEGRRKAAGRLFDKGKTAYFVAKKFAVATATAREWKERWAKGTLAAQPQGPRSKLTKVQEQEIVSAIFAGPEKAGYATQLWTLSRITELIRKTQAVSYKPRSAWHLLGRLGFSCQRPERRVKQRDEEAIARWTKTEWPKLRKRGRSFA